MVFKPSAECANRLSWFQDARRIDNDARIACRHQIWPRRDLMQIKVIAQQSVHLLLRESSEGAKFRHGGIYGQACSRSSGLGAFSGCGISPDSVPRLRRLHSYGSALRLCRSSLVGTGPRGTAWVRATDLRTTTLRTDSCLPSAAGGARLLHSAVSRSFAAVI